MGWKGIQTPDLLHDSTEVAREFAVHAHSGDLGQAPQGANRHVRLACRAESPPQILLLFQSLIIPRLKGRKELVLVEWKVLGKRDRHDSLFRINLAVRGCRAVPAELSHG